LYVSISICLSNVQFVFLLWCPTLFLASRTKVLRKKRAKGKGKFNRTTGHEGPER